MAAIGRGIFRLALRSRYSSALWCDEGCYTRCYSVFPPDFKEPVIRKEEIKKIVSEMEEQEVLAMKVRPALSNQTCSIFSHPDLEKFISYAMSRGNKHISREIIRDALTMVKHKQLRKYNSEADEEKKQNIIISPLEIFLLAIKNVTPMLWYVKVKKSGTWYKIPIGITPDKARRRAMKWIVEAVNEKDPKIPFAVELANELVSAAYYTGKAVSKKLEMHKMCESNRGYVNYWWT